MKHLALFSLVICGTVMLLGCGAKPIPTTPPPTEEAKDGNNLMKEWHQLAKADYDHVDMDRAMIIANELALQGPAGLDPFFKVLENPDETPMAKMLAVVSLSPHINDSHAKRLMPLTEAKYDATTRGCATHLLGICINPDAVFKVIDLTHDKDPHVSKVASMVMLRKGDKDVVPKILEIWNAPDANPRDREEIILGMPLSLAQAHTEIFSEAVCDDKLEIKARLRAAKLLGDIASSDIIPTLKKCPEKLTDTTLSEAVDNTIARIEARGETGEAPVQLQIPNGASLVFKPHTPETPSPTEDHPNEAAPKN